VGKLWRFVIWECGVIPTTYRPNGQVDGRGGEIRTPDILLPKVDQDENRYFRKLCVCNVFIEYQSFNLRRVSV
jgi:hypothetical protein